MKNLSIVLLLGFTMLANPVAAQKKKVKNTFYVQNTLQGFTNTPETAMEKAILLKTIGYDGLEGSGYKGFFELKDALDKKGLRMPVNYVGLRFEADGKLTDNLDGEIKEMIRATAKGDMIYFHLSSNSFKDASETGDDAVSSILRELSDYAAPYGVKLCAYPHINTYCETVAHSVKLAKMVDRKNYGASLNLCHLLKVEGSEGIEEKLKEFTPLLFAVNICGADEGDTKQMGWDRLIQPLGQGSFDTYHFIKVLLNNGYEGPIGLQCYNLKGDVVMTLSKSLQTWNDYKKRYLEELELSVFSSLNAKTFVVNNQMAGARDTNPGTFAQPLKTIQAGANLAQAGDTILVKAGIYREEVKPPRSGTKENPITYLAAPGENVSIRGSERITTWKREGRLWLATIDNAMFEDFNPYTTNVAGAWLNNSETSDTIINYHLGDVYYNGEAFYEVSSIADCIRRVNSWFTTQEHGKTLIRANFLNANPNVGLTEINVRATAIFPEISGLKYIVIDGFDIRHTASQWSDIYKLEEGAIGMRYGYGWVIQNCTITNSRNNGISMGVTDEVFFSRTLSEGGDNIPPYGSFGFHIIRNNIIKRCGQCAIYGCYGAVGSVIENNEISETLYRNEWSGPNQADIKILFPIDVTIRNNKFYGSDGSGIAIWLDWGSQNARVTGNLIVDRRVGVFTEVSFGPTVIDNNIFIRSGVSDWSDGNIYAHNLFYQSPNFDNRGTPSRPFVPYYLPHSTEVAGRGEVKLRHERWYNNIFIGDSASKVPQRVDHTSGFLVNNNVYLDHSPKFPFEGNESIVDKLKSEFEFADNSTNASLSFKLGPLIFEGTYPLITSKMIGKTPLPQVFMEHPDGTPLDITTDYSGHSIDPKSVKPGPFQNISSGVNKFIAWPHPKGK